MSTPDVRAPLPYPHEPLSDLPFACERPEDSPDRAYAFDLNCPGCTAGLMALAAYRPTQPGRPHSGHGWDGKWLPLVEIVRELPDFDPMRVLFERALASRVSASHPTGNET